MHQKNAINWFEIPAKDINRAQKFYEEILEIHMQALDLENFQMRIFSVEDSSGVAGALIRSGDFYKPSPTDGPLIYLSANPDVQKVLDRVVKAGGKITIPKTQISPEYGFMAVILDTEGNRIALRSLPQG